MEDVLENCHLSKKKQDIARYYNTLIAIYLILNK